MICVLHCAICWLSPVISEARVGAAVPSVPFVTVPDAGTGAVLPARLRHETQLVYRKYLSLTCLLTIHSNTAVPLIFDIKLRRIYINRKLKIEQYAT